MDNLEPYHRILNEKYKILIQKEKETNIDYIKEDEIVVTYEERKIKDGKQENVIFSFNGRNRIKNKDKIENHSFNYSSTNGEKPFNVHYDKEDLKNEIVKNSLKDLPDYVTRLIIELNE